MPSKRRKRHMISLSHNEFVKLGALKAAWEVWTGNAVDWGGFLMQVTASSTGAAFSGARASSYQETDYADAQPGSQQLQSYSDAAGALPPSIVEVLDDVIGRVEALEESRSHLSEIDRLISE